MEVGNNTAIGLYAGSGTIAVWQWYYYSPAVMGFIFTMIFVVSLLLGFFE